MCHLMSKWKAQPCFSRRVYVSSSRNCSWILAESLPFFRAASRNLCKLRSFYIASSISNRVHDRSIFTLWGMVLHQEPIRRAVFLFSPPEVKYLISLCLCCPITCTIRTVSVSPFVKLFAMRSLRWAKSASSGIKKLHFGHYNCYV